MMSMSNEKNLKSFTGVSNCFCVHLGDEWARRINCRKLLGFRFQANGRTDSVRTEDHNRTVWNFGD